jgi:hypothetical protein
MARGPQREAHSPDYINNEGDGDVLDFANLKWGGASAADISIVSEREFKDAAEYAAFMADPIIITLHTTTDKNAPPSVYAAVQGDGGWLPRGKKIRVPRSIVEVLARSQVTAFKTTQNNNMAADEAMDTTRSTAQDYAFSVLHDPNPKGVPWLRRVMHEGR